MAVKGVREIVQRFKMYDRMKMNRVEEAVERTQTWVVNRARNNHPYTDRTQNLTNSIQAGRVERVLGFVQGEVAANMKYAVFVEEGTSRAGAYPFLEPALFAAQGFFRREIARALR